MPKAPFFPFFPSVSNFYKTSSSGFSRVHGRVSQKLRGNSLFGMKIEKVLVLNRILALSSYSWFVFLFCLAHPIRSEIYQTYTISCLFVFIVRESRHLRKELTSWNVCFNISDRRWTPATPRYVSTSSKLPEAIHPATVRKLDRSFENRTEEKTEGERTRTRLGYRAGLNACASFRL